MGLWVVGTAELGCNECNLNRSKEYPCDSDIRKYMLHPEAFSNCLQYQLCLELKLGVAFIC